MLVATLFLKNTLNDFPSWTKIAILAKLVVIILKYYYALLSGMLSVSCREVGVDCDFVGKGESEKELMDNLVDHAIKDHGFTREDVLKPEMQEKIKAHIHKS